MICPNEDELGGYLNQELAPERLAAVEDHVGDCLRCQGLLELLVRRESPRELLRELGPDVPADAAPPGIPGFELTDLIGSGGMGRVWKARQLDAGGRIVAVKTVFGGAHAAPEWVSRFKTEIEALAELDHPNVVKLYMSGPTPHGFFYAMEYLPAGSLAADRRLNPEAWTVRRAAEVIAAAAFAIDHAHQHSLIHRDLKPAHILLADDGTPNVADFGLVRSLDGANDFSRTGRALGTPVYMAPEQADGSKQIGPASDVYGLGGVLYFLLTGLPPIPDDGSELDVLNRVRHDDPVSPRRFRPTIPKDLETICLKCLQKEPGRRYATAQELADDLQRFLSGRPILARPVGRPARAAMWVRRNPLPSAALALLALLAGTLGLFWRSEVRAKLAALQAREARQEADSATILQLRAERDRDRVQHQSAIETALRGGDPKKALALLAGAEANRVEITPEMRFLEVDALEATASTDQARERLEAMGEGLPPAYAARRDLRLGDLLVGIDDERARALIEKAKAAPTLSPGDKAYARGSLAATPAEAVAEFWDALDADPTHLAARRSLSLILLCAGQLEEATRTAEDGHLLYPEHPDFLWVLFLGHGLRGNESAAQLAFERVKPMVREDIHVVLGEVERALPLLGREFRAGIYGDATPFADQLRIARLSLLVPKLSRLVGLPGDGRFSDADILHRLPFAARNSLKEFWNLVKGTLNGKMDFIEIGADDAETARFGAMIASNPDGFMKFMYGMVLFTRAVAYKQRSPDELDGFRARIAEAAAAFEESAKCDGLIDMRLIALEKAVHSYYLAGKPGGGSAPNPEWARKAGELARQRLRKLDPVHPNQLDVLVKAATIAKDLSTARSVLDDWEDRQPNNLTAARSRADVEFKGEAYTPALRAAERVLAENPKDAETLAIADQCRAKLRLDASPPASDPQPLK